MGFGMCRRTSYHDQDSWVRFRNGGYYNASQAIINHQYGFAHVCPQIAILIGKYGKMMITHWNWDELGIPHDNLNDMAMFGEIHQSPRRARTARAVAGWAQGGFGNVQVKCYLDIHVPGVIKPEEKTNKKSHADIYAVISSISLMLDFYDAPYIVHNTLIANKHM